MSVFDAQLRAAGMSERESAVKAALLENLMRELHELRGEMVPQHQAFFVPGRLEVLGKHTDYAGGRSLICAIERGICLVAAPRTDTQIHLVDAGCKTDVRFALDQQLEPTCGHWSNYGITVARRMARDFPAARTGADILFTSDLPQSSGMSSSSAFVIGLFLALAEINSLSHMGAFRRCIQSTEDLAGYLAAVENGAAFASLRANRGVGTLGGSEDHVAILCSGAGLLRQYSFCPIRLEREIPMPPRHTFVIAVSGVQADKTGDARESYNRICLATRTIFKLWRSATGRNDASLAAALSSEPGAAERLREILCGAEDSEYPANVLVNRLIQFADESNRIIPSAGDALARRDLETAGVLVDQSQSLAETLLGNQTPETMELAWMARALGAAASSAFGAGFGGSVWALVSSDCAEEFRDMWASAYRRRYPAHAPASQLLITGAGPGVVQF